MILHCAGYRVKRSIVVSVSVENRRRSKQNTTIDSQESHWAGYGKVWSRMDIAPVPIVEVNHLHEGQHGSQLDGKLDLTLA